MLLTLECTAFRSFLRMTYDDSAHSVVYGNRGLTAI